MVLGSAVSASQGTWERRFSGPTPDPLTQPLLGWGPAMCVSMNLSRESKAGSTEDHCSLDGSVSFLPLQAFLTYDESARSPTAVPGLH